ncbi:hypothetical protein BCV72DRAFT_313773 [Rhizopus microsporus var. microsporus]|uniref:Uncharacterized protein n=1 Tax=Rhizopus microsporus var. microsporus TaxID=86635 RepID=A0A1X0RER1_RHIZD|nr:hypothetical protein BCV72DRAFT_313773 [Rhizopus microsporus var. microsporus]
MVLPHNVPKPPNRSGGSSSSQPLPTSPIPYSKIHERSSKTKPSVQSSTAQTHVDNPSNQQKIIIETTHISVSQSAGRLFFDVSSRAETVREIYMAAFRQSNDFVVNFDIDKNRAAALKAGLTFNDGSVIITPSVVMKPGSMIKRINLDQIHDVGVVKDADSGTFLGAGYVIIDCSSELNTKYADLLQILS